MEKRLISLKNQKYVYQAEFDRSSLLTHFEFAASGEASSSKKLFPESADANPSVRRLIAQRRRIR